MFLLKRKSGTLIKRSFPELQPYIPGTTIKFAIAKSNRMMGPGFQYQRGNIVMNSLYSNDLRPTRHHYSFLISIILMIGSDRVSLS